MGNEPGEAPTVANTVEIMQQQQNVSFNEFLSGIYNLSYARHYNPLSIWNRSGL